MILNLLTQIQPVPVPIYISDGGGEVTTKGLIIAYILLSIPSVLFILISSFIWLIKAKEYCEYVEYVFIGDISIVSTLTLFIVNGVALLALIGYWLDTII